MKGIIREYLTFNKRERNGIFILLAIITLLIVYLNISHYFIKEEKIDFSNFDNEIQVLQSNIAQENSIPKKELYQHKEFVKSEIMYFNFNPNKLPNADWEKLGLSDKQIRIIKNYESKGGKFKTKDDVKKMYCISEKQYLSLEPYIQLPPPDPLLKETEKKTITAPELVSSIDINSTDSAQLEGLKGIGAFYAKTIVNYRNTLGGFVRKEQLMEVWKFDEQKFDLIKDQVMVDISNVKKININTCTAAELKHPYLKWNSVNVIINYRNKHGKYKSVEEIKKTDLIDDETYIKIAPYLIVE